MTFPLGDHLMGGLGLLALVLNSSPGFFKIGGGISLAWLLGRIPENMLWWETPPYHWHFSYLAVLLCFGGIAWQKTQGRKILPSFTVAFAFAGQNLFYVNEPGLFRYDRWFFAGIILFIAYLCTKDLWGMGLALCGGMLFDLGISVFLLQGIVRHYDLPDPFFWNVGTVFLVTAFGVRVAGHFIRGRNEDCA